MLHVYDSGGLFMCVGMCVTCVYICVCACTNVCTCTWKPEVDTECLPQLLSILFSYLVHFLAGSFTESGTHQFNSAGVAGH